MPRSKPYAGVKPYDVEGWQERAERALEETSSVALVSLLPKPLLALLTDYEKIRKALEGVVNDSALNSVAGWYDCIKAARKALGLKEK